MFIEALEGVLGIYGCLPNTYRAMGYFFVKIQSTFRDMVTHSFLKWDEFWGYLPIYFRDTEHFSGPLYWSPSNTFFCKNKQIPIGQRPNAFKILVTVNALSRDSFSNLRM